MDVLNAAVVARDAGLDVMNRLFASDGLDDEDEAWLGSESLSRPWLVASPERRLLLG